MRSSLILRRKLRAERCHAVKSPAILFARPLRHKNERPGIPRPRLAIAPPLFSAFKVYPFHGFVQPMRAFCPTIEGAIRARVWPERALNRFVMIDAKALEIADRAYVLEQGRIVASGAPESLLARSEIREAYLGFAD